MNTGAPTSGSRSPLARPGSDWSLWLLHPHLRHRIPKPVSLSLQNTARRKSTVRVRPRSLFVRRLKASRLRTDFHRRIASQVAHEIAGKWLVDVGCGPGLLAKHLGQVAPPMRLIGVDIDPWMLRVAKSEQRMETIRGSSLALPFKDRTIGTVVSSASLKDWTDPRAGLHEITRVLSPKGVGLVYDFATTGVGSSPTGFRHRYGFLADFFRRAMRIFAPFSFEDAKTIAQGLEASTSILLEEDLPVIRIMIRKDSN